MKQKIHFYLDYAEYALAPWMEPTKILEAIDKEVIEILNQQRKKAEIPVSVLLEQKSEGVVAVRFLKDFQGNGSLPFFLHLAAQKDQNCCIPDCEENAINALAFFGSEDKFWKSLGQEAYERRTICSKNTHIAEAFKHVMTGHSIFRAIERFERDEPEYEPGGILVLRTYLARVTLPQIHLLGISKKNKLAISEPKLKIIEV